MPMDAPGRTWIGKALPRGPETFLGGGASFPVRLSTARRPLRGAELGGLSGPGAKKVLLGAGLLRAPGDNANLIVKTT